MKIISSRRRNILFVGPEMRKKNRFRVAIFGSARIEQTDQEYQTVYQLAKLIGAAGMDVVTGGGPGMMQAANQGHNAGDVKGVAESIGLIINLPWENKGNPFLEIYKKFDHFSNRLDTFLKLADAIIITKGGIGTLLELFYVWQHLQVKHIDYKPIILMGEMWETLIEWMKKHPLATGMISPSDFDFIYIVKSNEEAMQLVKKFQEQKQVSGKMQKFNVSELKEKMPLKQVIAVKTKKVVIKSMPKATAVKISKTAPKTAKKVALQAVAKKVTKVIPIIPQKAIAKIAAKPLPKTTTKTVSKAATKPAAVTKKAEKKVTKK
jgi:uncharacterized protein (TIGR00730 family)